MPKRILVIGVLFCLFGVFSIWSVISDLLKAHININLAVLMLPVGIGLLKGKSSSQWWARFWIILGYVSCVMLIVLSIAFPGNLKASWGSETINGSAAIPYVIAAAMALFVALLVTHKALYSKKAQTYFQPSANQSLE